MLRGGVRLVQPLQRAVVPFVQPPMPVHRQPHLIDPVEYDPERANGALEHGGVRHVEEEAFLLQQLRRPCGLLAAGFGEIDVDPPSEPVFFVPRALAVSQQYHLMHR